MNRDARQILTELLVLKAQGGDERAFTELYQLWNPDVRRIAMMQVGQATHVDEVTQDAWVTIARSLRRLSDPSCFPRWAFRILERRCADWIRRRQTDRRRAETLSTDEAGDARASSGCAVAMHENDNIAMLREAVARLDPDARKLLHLFYELGFSVAEIAEILDVPPGTVKSRLFTLRESLRQTIERIRL